MSEDQPTLARWEASDGVATVTLTNERRRNAITVPMVEQIVEIFDAIEADEAIGAVVITGAGEAFCAGADLRHLVAASSGDSKAETSLRSVYKAFLRVYDCPLPTLAAVNGSAVGAGMNLALACDVRVAGQSALFSTRFLSLALHPGGGHTWMLRNAIGSHAANAAVLFGEDFDGAEAARIGLAWKCFDDEALQAEAHKLASVAAKAPRGVAERAKESIRQMRDINSYPDAVDLEITKQLWSAAQADFQDRMAGMAAATRTGE